MKENAASKALDGSLGLFYPENAAVDEAETLRGYLDRDGGWARLQTLIERDEGLIDGPPVPDIITGRVSDTTVVLLEFPPYATSRNLTGNHASTRTYRARTLVGDVPLARLRSAKVLAIQADFLGITHWAGFEPVATETDHDQAGRVTAYRLSLGSRDPQITTLSRSRSLELSVDWSVSSSVDAPSVYAPVTITCMARRPRPVLELLQPLLRVQELISFAYSDFVSATGGKCVPHLRELSESHEPTLASDDHLFRRPMWNGALMVPASSIATTRRTNIPTFGLQSLGGVDGLRRWVSLAERYDRATSALTEQYRVGPASASSILRSAANGIEYWVAAHRKSAWARLPKGTKHASPAKALARHAGLQFKNWIGEPDAWAEVFWNTYNSLKHDPAFIVDQPALRELAESGRVLLGSALLNRAGRSSTPSSHLLASGRIYQLGFYLRKRYGW